MPEGHELPPETATETALYSRTSWGRNVRSEVQAVAPRNIRGEQLCDTCGTVIPERITVQTKNGPQGRVGGQLDHIPTLADRKRVWREGVHIRGEAPPSRAEVRKNYNDVKLLRELCPECNQGHKFENMEGVFRRRALHDPLLFPVFPLYEK